MAWKRGDRERLNAITDAVMDNPPPFPFLKKGLEMNMLDLLYDDWSGTHYHVYKGKNLKDTTAMYSSIMWVLTGCFEHWNRDFNKASWGPSFAIFPWLGRGYDMEAVPKVMEEGEFVDWYRRFCKTSDLQAQVEKAPEAFAANYQLLGNFVKYAVRETKIVGRAPTRFEITPPDLYLMRDLKDFFQSYVLDRLLTPETLTRFVNPSGAFEKGQLTTNGFNYFIMLESLFKYLGVESHWRLNQGIPLNYPTDNIKMWRMSKEEWTLPDGRTIDLPNLHGVWSLFRPGDDEESRKVPLQETAYVIYTLGMGARRWGFRPNMTQQDANLIADKMKRQLDFVLCSKTIQMFKMRIDKGVAEEDCLFGTTSKDIQYLRDYGKRLNKIKSQGWSLACEDALEEEINSFFSVPKRLDLIDKNPEMSAAGMMVNLENAPAVKFQDEVRSRMGGGRASYQDMVRSEIDAKQAIGK